MAQRSILIVAPHPDDETLGCGGIIAGGVQEGCRIAVAVVTDGCNLFRLSKWKIETDPTPAEISAMRKEETRCAVDALGSSRDVIRFLDVEDAALADNIEPVSERISEIIHEVQPDEIYVTSEHEEHSDHIAACGIVRLAMQKTQCAARLYRYTILLRRGLQRSAIDDLSIKVDISGQLDIKRSAANLFASHLQIVGKGQTEPFFENVDPWLLPNEEFFADTE